MWKKYLRTTTTTTKPLIPNKLGEEVSKKNKINKIN
jgi:hypothetical protein